jgi:flagellar basal body rod protein FlgB
MTINKRQRQELEFQAKLHNAKLKGDNVSSAPMKLTDEQKLAAEKASQDALTRVRERFKKRGSGSRRKN